MSDYMFMLESHLSAEQSRVVAAVQKAAAEANVNLFLAGGALRDMFGGFPVRDLDFVVEGNALKLAKPLAEQGGATLVQTDEVRSTMELIFPGGITAEIGAARTERYPKAGGKPEVTLATIHDDLRRRDFTINAIALSLNRASRGLLLDPTNGLSDLERKELRTVSNYALYDRPVRLLRLLRFRVRFGFTLEQRTQQQYENARAAELEKQIPASELFEELKRVAEDQNPTEVLRLFDEEKVLSLYSPALTGAKLNIPALQKLQKVRTIVPFEVDFPVNHAALLLAVLAEKLTPKERLQIAQALQMSKADQDLWQKLDARAAKLGKTVASPALHKPSEVYNVLSKATGEEILYLYMHSPVRLVQDRIRNYLQKYLPTAQDIMRREQAGQEAPNSARESAKSEKMIRELIMAKLDGRRTSAPQPKQAAMAAAARRGS